MVCRYILAQKDSRKLILSSEGIQILIFLLLFFIIFPSFSVTLSQRAFCSFHPLCHLFLIVILFHLFFTLQIYLYCSSLPANQPVSPNFPYFPAKLTSVYFFLSRACRKASLLIPLLFVSDNVSNHN